jgi:hypothetical protein
MALAIGQRVTLLTIDEALAMTHRYELEVRLAREPQQAGYEGRKSRVAVVRQRGRRKDFYLDLGAEDILFDGWGLPFRTDTEGGGVMSGNACYNLVGEPDAIRECIENRAALLASEGAKAKILISRAERTQCDDEGLALLYPDIETHHAVVNRLKAERA